MTQYQESLPPDDNDLPMATAGEGLAIAFYLFGSILILVAGSFHFMIGLGAVLNDEFYSVRPGYDPKLDTAAWGWVQIVIGVVMMVTAISLLSGAVWARITALVIAMLSAIWSFYSIPYYPIWSVLIIAFDAGIIWALVAHGDLFRELDESQRPGV
jgi:hypothetical protein